MKVLIVGGGIAGLALAAFLEKEEIPYEVIEKEPAYSRHGYLVSIWANGRDMLYKLGLGEKFDASATPITTYSLRDAKGHVIKEYDFSRLFSIGAVVSSIERRMLHEWLQALVPKHSLTSDCTVRAVSESSEGVRVTFSSGKSAHYDLVIGADGINSSLRNLLFKKQYRHYQNWRIWYGWVEHGFDIPSTITEYIDEKSIVSVFGTRNKATAWFLSPVSHTEFDSPEGRKTRLLELFKHSAPFVNEALQNLRDADFVPSDLAEVRLRTPLAGHCVLIGDAAHGFGPFTGLGCSLALEDAYVLAAELKKGMLQRRTIPDILRTYTRRRAPRIRHARLQNLILRTGAAAHQPLLRKVLIFLSRFIPQNIVFGHFKIFLRSEL